MLHTYINYIIDSINNSKTLIIVRYTPILYSILSILEKEFRLIGPSFIFRKWIFVRLLKSSYKKKLRVKIFNSKLKKSFFSYKKLKRFLTRSTHVIVYSPKGICSAYTAIQQKQGGIIYCIIY